MTKNITVTDEQGKITGSTYPKRATGLVKKGRARWINADTICLCVPDKEGIKMANNLYEVLDNQLSKMQQQTENDSPETALATRELILKTMENFRAQEQKNKVIEMVQEQLAVMQQALDNEPPIPDTAPERESTRQKILELLTKLVDNETKD